MAAAVLFCSVVSKPEIWHCDRDWKKEHFEILEYPVSLSGAILEQAEVYAQNITIFAQNEVICQNVCLWDNAKILPNIMTIPFGKVMIWPNFGQM